MDDQSDHNLDPFASAAWYAIQVRSRHEKLVAMHLEEKGIEYFLPLYLSRRKWSDRYKMVELPLFPGYLFCHIQWSNRLPVLIIPGVCQIVGKGSPEAKVSESELDAIRRAVELKTQITPCSHFQQGTRLRIHTGPLKGIEGLYQRSTESIN